MQKPIPKPPTGESTGLADESNTQLSELTHRMIDRLLARTMGVAKAYTDGWGNPELLSKLIKRIAQFRSPTPIEIQWLRERKRLDGVRIRNGYFLSPTRDLPLPPATRTAYFQLVLPPTEVPQTKACVQLAGYGDATYLARRQLAIPLAKEEGIGSFILQNPFYGSRKPEYQLGNRLKTIVDQILQNLVAIEETRSLLIWLRNNDYDHLGVTGYSMGGYMAAIASQLVSFPLAVTPCATGHSVMYPLIRSPLKRLVDWKALGAELSKPYNARSTLARLFARVCVPNIGQLNDDSSAVIVGNKYDEFIDPADIKKLHSHWKHSRLRWVPAGHTTGWFLKRRHIRKAISDSFEKLING